MICLPGHYTHSLPQLPYVNTSASSTCFEVYIDGIITVIYPLLPGLFHSEFGKSHLPLMDICDVFIFSLYMIYLRVRACMLSRFSHVQLFATLWTDAHLASLSMDSPGKSTGGGCHFLLQGIFPTKESNSTSFNFGIFEIH